MGIFDREIQVIRDSKNVIIPTLIDVIRKFDFVILDYNTNQQLDKKGEDSKGNKLGTYSNSYARIRVKKGLQVKHVDTHFTGKFHATLQVITQNDQLKIVSNVDYADEIIEKYGEEVLGVQREYLEEFMENFILPELKRRIDDKFTRAVN